MVSTPNLFSGSSRDGTSMAFGTTQPFVTESAPGVVRFVLPRRVLGEYAKFGGVLAALGLFVTGFMLMWMWLPVQGAMEQFGDGNWAFALFMLIFASFGLYGMFWALGMILLGICIMRDRTQCVVEIKRGKLFSNERLGPFTWKRKQLLDKIETLSIGSANEDRPGGRGRQRKAATTERFEAIIAISGDGESRFLVSPGYQRFVLEPLAAAITQHLNAQHVEVSLGEEQGSATVNTKLAVEEAPALANHRPTKKPRVELALDRAGKSDRPSKPSGTRITIHEQDESTAYNVPAAGIGKGSKGLFFFSLLWNGFMVVFSTAAVFGMIEGKQEGPLWMALVFVGLFWGVGIWMLLLSINMGTRSVMIGVLGDQLFLERKSVFGTRWQEYRSDEIEQICCGPSGMEVNDVPVMELQVHLTNGKKDGLLAQLTTSELEWLACELSDRLPLVSSVEEDDSWRQALAANGTPVKPPSSDVEVMATTREVQMRIPPRRVLHNVSVAITSLVFMLVGAGIVAYLVEHEMKNGWDWGKAFALGFPGLFAATFVAAGIAMFAGWLVYNRRRFEITATPANLKVIRRGLLGRKVFSWPSVEIEMIDVESSGTSVNGKTLEQLRIRCRTGPGLSMMTGRPVREIAFVAAHLNLVMESVARNAS